MWSSSSLSGRTIVWPDIPTKGVREEIYEPTDKKDNKFQGVIAKPAHHKEKHNSDRTHQCELQYRDNLCHK